MNRPTWDTYFMAMAKLASTRSHDPDTKHGAVLVDGRHRVLSTGYNGYPHGGGESDYPDARPGKYLFIVHAEINALLHAAAGRVPATLYCTGFPCCSCFHAIIQAGIKRVVLGDVESACVGDDQKNAVIKMAEVHGVKLEWMELAVVGDLFRDMLETPTPTPANLDLVLIDV